MKTWARRLTVAIVGVLVLLVTFLVGAAFWGAGQASYPAWLPQYRKLRSNPKLAYGYDYQDVNFLADDGGVLRGWFVPGRPGARVGVMTVHGAGGNREEFMAELRMLHEAGYPVLMFDCREQGESDGHRRGISLGVREHRDVESAVRYFKNNYGLNKVVAFGCSQGAASSILAAAEDRNVDGVIAEASFLRIEELAKFNIQHLRPDLPISYVDLIAYFVAWRMGARGAPGPVDVIGAIAPRPVLLMQGNADNEVPPHDAEALYQRAREPKSIWIGEGAGHCELRERYPDRYRQHVMAFLQEHFPNTH
jgi:alpha-beta hydrolase superfamily lysophospholipase